MFKSTDEGESWFEVSNGIIFNKKFVTGIGFENFYYNVVIHPTRPNEIYLSGYLGDVYKSVDGGKSWSDYSQGLVKGGIITDLEVDPSGNTLIISQKAGGVSLRGLE